MEVKPVTTGRLDDLATLFGSSGTTKGCYCMWFLVSAKECHEGWGATNQARFAEVTAAAPEPVGLLAYRDGEPVGWCAAGPRARYARALRSPLYKARQPDEDDDVWLVPCFYIRRDARRGGLTHALLTAAVDLAATHGAKAIEGFPLNLDKTRSSGDAYVGLEPVFAACGFRPVARPSTARVIMRRDI